METIETLKQALEINSNLDALIIISVFLYAITICIVIKWFLLPLVDEISNLIFNLIKKIRSKKNDNKQE